MRGRWLGEGVLGGEGGHHGAALSELCLWLGIDTLPVPGNLGCKSISHILADTLALAKRWNKQLSCRLLPCPGKEAGEKTDFRSPYLVDATL